MARAAEQETREADAFLNVVTLWTRPQLDARLGNRRQGQWWLRIDRLAPGLYEVTLTDSLARAPILRTTMHRPLDDTGGG
jgi:hypothetical protein